MDMHTRIQGPRTRLASVLRSQAGQSLILALSVMFLLVFIGGLFIGIVGRNILRAQRSGEVLSVQYLAEAGIRYADHQLTYSEEGADWRPVPDYPAVVIEKNGGPASNASQRPSTDDPDYTWLMEGFSRYSYGKGRFLLRITYDPRPGDPMSKFIKVESIGRMGVVDPNDPTTFQNRQPIRLRKELVAYKPIAITDYARFVTNKDRRPAATTLGVPEFVTSFGEQGANHVLGAPIRVNGDLIWQGRNLIWLDPARGQGVEVAGDIRHEDSANGSPGEVYVNGEPALESVLADFNTAPGVTTAPVNPADPEIGWYRDGNPGEDALGRPREITRLEPPNLDAVGVSGRLSRYRELTRNSGEWRRDPQGNWYNTGYYGWGDGIYIDNTRDIQEESVGYTLRSDWTQPGESQYWHGPYYDPPGITVVLLPYDSDGADRDGDGVIDGPDILITRNERDRYIWLDRNGAPMSETGEQMTMPYPKNGVLFAEGNIRIKGMLAPGKQMTVVSGGTIYVDGNILKYRNPQTGEIAPDCSAALLAEDYVCVNTTQFFGPMKEVPYPGPGSGFFDVSPTSSFWFTFAFGEHPAAYNRRVELLVRHTAAPGGATYMNMLVNWPPTDAQLSGSPYYSFYQFNLAGWAASVPMRYIYPLGDAAAWPAKFSSQQYESWEHQVFGLWPISAGEYDFRVLPGVENRIGFQLDQSLRLPSGAQDYYVSRAIVQPMDVRVEAMMYAQNKSFFVIPGEWVNPDPEDLRGNRADAPNMVRRLPDGPTDSRWPFYGQPPDVRIVISGAISENLAASVGDSSAWMGKWGWIPIEHGSSGELTEAYRPPLDPNTPNDERRKGLTIVYDELLSHPLFPGTTDALRRDEFRRPLPIAPRLPVSPQTIYIGRPT